MKACGGGDVRGYRGKDMMADGYIELCGAGSLPAPPSIDLSVLLAVVETQHLPWGQS